MCFSSRANSRQIWFGLFLVLLFLFPAFSGCLVNKAKYLKVIEEKESYHQSLDQCRSELEQTGNKQLALQEKLNKSQAEINTLMEDLASLEIERQENLNKIVSYKKKLEAKEAKTEKVTDTYQVLMEQLSQEVNDGKIRIDQSENRLKLNLVNKVLFASGSAALSARGKEVLEKVGFVLQDLSDRKILIEGHTDNIPIKTNLKKRFASNWELSAMRASAVVRYLQEYVGIDARLLSATGYSMYQPLAVNDTAEGRQANRRIEIILTPFSPQEMQRIHSVPEPPFSSLPPRAPPQNGGRPFSGKSGQ